MSCNCGTAKQIDRLYKSFGINEDKDDNDYTLFEKVKAFFVNKIAKVVVFLMIPLVVAYVTTEYRKGNNKISLKTFLGFE